MAVRQAPIPHPITTPSTGRLTEPWAMYFSRLGAGSGDVVGPSVGVDGDIALFDGTTGKLIKDGGTLSHLLDLLPE